MSAFDALFGRILSRDTEIELSQGLNFKGGLRALFNPATKLTEIDFGENADHGDLQIADGIHTSTRWLFADQTARRAQALTVLDLGRRAIQLSDATEWVVLPSIVAPGTYVWGQSCAGPEVIFNGDYAALAATFSLTTRLCVRGDLGTSGSLGTGIATWANQSGSASNIAGGDTNGMTVTAGLGGKAGVSANGATQRGIFTMPTQVAPGTTNIHKWWIGRALANAGGGNISLFSGGSGTTDFVQLAAGGANHLQYQNGAGATTTGVVINQWYRGRASLTGSANDQIRIGAHAPTPTITSNTAPGSVNRGIFSDYGGGNKVNYELLSYLELEGPLANFLAFDAVAGPYAQAFWSSAIEI